MKKKHITDLPEGFVFAIDGMAASGKGTLSKKLSEYFCLPHMDTGLLYRSVAWIMLDRKYDIDSIRDRSLAVSEINNIPEDVNLKTKEMGEFASIIAVYKDVRENLLKVQRDFASNPLGAILDGRDISTVVCPEANYKLFVTANIDIRTRRRLKELQKLDNCDIGYEDVLRDLRKRDKRDMSRANAPLSLPDSAVHLDTSYLSVNEMLNRVVRSVMLFINL